MSIRSSVILTPDRLVEVRDYILTKDAFAFDVETTGDLRGMPLFAPVSWLSLATEGLAVAIPMGHPNGDTLISRATKRKDRTTNKFVPIPAVYSPPPKQMRPSQVWEILAPLMTSDREKIAHNASFDLLTTAKYNNNEPFPGPYHDTIVMQWLLDENLKSMGLKNLVKNYFQHDYDLESVGKCVEAHPFSKVAHYAYLDSKYTWLLYRKFRQRISDEGLDQIYSLEMDLLNVLLDMRLAGVTVDYAEMLSLKESFGDQLIEIEGRIYQAAGKKFNVNSNQQKQQILYGPKAEGGQGLRVSKFTDGGAPSTAADTLEAFPKNAVAAALLEYAEVSKLLNTYINGYLGDEETGKPTRVYGDKVYPELVQYGTTTGRLSCRSPNVQNISSAATPSGKKVRNLFVAPEGHSLVVSDYGQIELVILAHYSRAKALVDGFSAGIDAHTATASKVFHVAPQDVTKPMRSVAKALGFAVAYGAGPDKVAAMSATSVKEAKQFLEKHEKEFPEVYALKSRILRTARGRKPPHIRTLLGRKRRLPTLMSSNKGLRMYAERQAVNSLIQGSAADVVKMAMVRLHDLLDDDMELILSVHDELVVSCPDAKVERGKDLIYEAMLGEDMQNLMSVPLTADTYVVKKWGEAK